MTDTKKLENIIDMLGLKLTFLARQLDISYQTLRLKMDNKREFSPTQINKLCSILNITDLEEKESVFFALFVE